LTYRLYNENSYINECESKVVEVIEKEGRFLAVLDVTPFYPEGGGQPSDIGLIDDAKVLYVFEENETIYHVTDRKLQQKEVKCYVDFERRFDFMQQHSGEHLLSAAFFKLFKGVNCGFHMGEEYVTIDIDLKEVTEDMLCQIEETANQYVTQNLEVYNYIVTREEVKKLPMRKEVKVDEGIRIVQMGEADYSACCGTHVVRTGEIGLIKIIKTEKYKGMTRVYFKCGKRALKDYMNKHNIISSLGKLFSAEENSLVKTIEAQNLLVKELNRKILEAKKQLAAIEAKHLIGEAQSQIILKNFEDKTFEDVQIISSILESEPFIALLSSLQDRKVVMSQNGKYNVSCGKLFKEKLAYYNGKGGGNDRKAQAAFQTNEELLQFTKAIIEIVKDYEKSAL
jgi:alanyl-tRNA synthetase